MPRGRVLGNRSAAAPPNRPGQPLQRVQKRRRSRSRRLRPGEDGAPGGLLRGGAGGVYVQQQRRLRAMRAAQRVSTGWSQSLHIKKGS